MSHGAIGRAQAAATAPVSGASAAALRIAFGLLATVAAVRFMAMGWIGPLYVEPEHHFTYWGFGWVTPWPEWGLYLHFTALAALGLAIALGWHYRLATALFFVGFTYVELLDRATYLNHYYLVSALSLLMVALPLHRAFSLDARRAGRAGDAGLPAWVIWALRVQVGVVYCFAGIAKLNPDWLLDAQPLTIWLAQRADMPLIGPLLAERATAYALSWAGAAFDLSIVGWLLWRRTRLAAYAALIAFHLTLAVLFPEIGLFPWIMIAAASIFLAPDWPLRLQRRSGRSAVAASRPVRLGRLAPAIVVPLLALQLVIPFRHLMYPGDVRWTDEGSRFSWRVMLSEKVGVADYRVTDAAGHEWRVDPGLYLTPLQQRMAAIQPDMIRDTAHWIAADFAARGAGPVAVRVDAYVAMNGRPHRRIVDPATNLAAEPAELGPADWILR